MAKKPLRGETSIEEETPIWTVAPEGRYLFKMPEAMKDLSRMGDRWKERSIAFSPRACRTCGTPFIDRTGDAKEHFSGQYSKKTHNQH